MKPDADSQQQTRLIVEKHNQRWAAGDLEGIFALYDPDMVLTDHYTSKSYTGAGLRKHITQVIQRSRLDSLTYTDAIRVDGDTAVLQYSETIRSASGNDLLQIRACDVVRVRRALIIEIQEYALPARSPSDSVAPTQSAEKIGLTARALGYLLDDLATYFERDQPFLRPDLNLQDVANATVLAHRCVQRVDRGAWHTKGLGHTFFFHHVDSRFNCSHFCHEKSPWGWEDFRSATVKTEDGQRP